MASNRAAMAGVSIFVCGVIVYGCISASAPPPSSSRAQSLSLTNLIVLLRPTSVAAHNWRTDARRASNLVAEEEVKQMSRTQLLRKLASINHLLVQGNLNGVVRWEGVDDEARRGEQAGIYEKERNSAQLSQTSPTSLTAPRVNDKSLSDLSATSSSRTNASANTINGASALEVFCVTCQSQPV